MKKTALLLTLGLAVAVGFVKPHMSIDASTSSATESYYYYTCNVHAGKLGHYSATQEGLRQCVEASNKHATDFRHSTSSCVLNQ
jgi:hypothetical protein